jgi:2,5-diketo-D-gluconate reductase B
VARAHAHAPIFCNQVEYHPFLDQTSVLEACRQREMMLTAYSPLANGRVIGDPNLKRIGERHGKTAAQVALRWLVDQPLVSAIPRSSKPDHVAANLDVFDFELSGVERAEIDALAGDLRFIDPDWAPEWD